MSRQDGPTWREYGGRQWVSFAPAEKRAYVAGFLAGAGLLQGELVAGDHADSARVRVAVDSLARTGGLRFALDHMVYATRLDDFYWWENHVPVRLYLALRGLNDRMRAGQQEQQ